MAAESAPQPIGTLLNGTYRLERVIAKGAMGVVYEAIHLRLARRVAVKLLSKPQDGTTVGTALVRFDREAEIASKLSHPHIVEVFDYQVAEDGAPFLVMELIDGEDLADRLRHAGALSVSKSLRILHEIAEALDVAHAGGVVHRDLKPANIFLARRGGRDDFVKVLDFGVSKLLDAATLTQDRAMIGTPLYMSPEQAVGSQDLTPQSDVFSLGAIAFEMLTGHRAFAAPTIPAILFQIVHGPTPTLEDGIVGVDPGIDAVFARALAKKPQERYLHATDFAAALAQLIRPSDSSFDITAGWRTPPSIPRPSEAAAFEPGEVVADNTDIDSTTRQRDGRPGSGSTSRRSASVSGSRRTPAPLGDEDKTSISLHGVGFDSKNHADDSGELPEPSSAPDPRVRSDVSLGAADAGSGAGRGVLVAVIGTVGLFALVIAVLASTHRPPAFSPSSNQSQSPPLQTHPVEHEAEAPAPVSHELPVLERHPDVRFVFHIDPQDAEISIDGRPIFGGDVMLAWQTGKRHIKVEASGYRPLSLLSPSTADHTFELRLERLSTRVKKSKELKEAKEPKVVHPTHDVAPVQDL